MVDSIGSVFKDWRRAESVDSIGTVFTDVRNAESVDSIGSVLVVPELPATTPSLPAPSYYWRFNTGSGSTAVASVGGQDGTIVGSPTWATGIQGTALNYATNSEYTTLPTTSTTYFSSATFTVSMWINRNADKTWAYFLDHNGEKISINSSGSPGGSWVEMSINGTQQFHLDTGIAAGTWYHLCITSSASDVILYINSVNKGGKGSAGVAPTMTGGAGTPIFIGKYKSGVYNSNSIIDELAIWDGTALSATEVGLVYDGGSPPDITSGIASGPSPTKHYVPYVAPPFKPDVVWF